MTRPEATDADSSTTTRPGASTAPEADTPPAPARDADTTPHPATERPTADPAPGTETGAPEQAPHPSAQAATRGEGSEASAGGDTPEGDQEQSAKHAGAATLTLTATDRAALEAERDFLLESLRDLESEHQAGELDEERYDSLQSSYSARAARVLRTLEAAGPATEPEPRPAGGQRRWRRRAAVLVPLAAVVAAGAILLPSALSRRDPGESITGNAQTTAGNADDTEASLRRAVTERPDDPDAHRSYARVLLGDGDLVNALRHFDKAAQLDPDDAESRAYAGWIVSLAGLPDEALERLDAAVSADPTYPDAHFFRGMVLLRGTGDATGAARELRRYLELDPGTPMRDQIEQILAGLDAAPGE
jgi:tetratricopeptide (TPR) repeat protein